MDLVEVLAAEGLVAVVGAGGKTSTMYALADRLDRAVVTATVRIPIFDHHVTAVVVTDDPVTVLRDAAGEGADRFPLGVVPEREGDGDRYRGYDTAVGEDLAAEGLADAVLVKADGARNREFKAPGENEPQVPAAADTVIPVVSAHVEGEKLTERLVHRPERVVELTDLSPGDPILAEQVAQVLTHPEGGLKGVPDDATVVPVINKIDEAAHEAAGNRIATRLLQHERIDRVALTQFADPEDPLVAVLE
jgi:probable selenium-dependent hydroxylase accessory protein YqeC